LIHKNIPVLDTKQMKEVDRLMIECYNISLEQMMENTGRDLALLAKKFLNNSLADKKICVVVGNGNNGGGGLVAARNLSNWGAEVTVLVATPSKQFKPVPAKQLEIIRHLPVSVMFAGKLICFMQWNKVDLVIDAIFGYGLNRKPRGITATVIKKINAMKCPVIALDAPSGLNTDEGVVSEVTVKADATLTLALPKKGLLTSEAEKYTGDIYLSDISVPPILYTHLGLNVKPIFEHDSVIIYKSNECKNEKQAV